MDTDHTCPAERYTRKVPADKLLCGHHWAMVPSELRRELYAAYHGGRHAGSERHVRAMRACVDAVDEELRGGQLKL